jgi:hypothetical protein
MKARTLQRWFLITSAAFSVCWWSASSVAQEQTPMQRFVNEAPKAWSEINDINQDIEYEISSTTKNWVEDGKKWESRRESIVKSRGEMVLEQTTTQPAVGSDLPAPVKRAKTSRSRVEAVNDTNAFILNKEGTSEWVVNYVKPVTDNKATARIRTQVREGVLWPWYLADKHFPDLYRDPGFHLGQVESVQEGGQELVKVSFTYTPQQKEDKDPLRSGWVLLRPDARWSIQRGEADLVYRQGDRAKLTLNIDYRADGDVIPLKSVQSLVFVNKSRGYETSAEFLKFERHPVPVDEFTMAAYGINLSTAPQTNRLPWILLNVGIVLLIIGIILYRRFRPRKFSTS